MGASISIDILLVSKTSTDTSEREMSPISL